MLKCISCGKEYPDDYQTEMGCTCGSKVFALKNENKKKIKPSEDFEICIENENEKIKFNMPSEESEEIHINELDEKDIIENIRIKEKGVFEIHLDQLFKSPVIIKDEKEIYYIKLPYNKGNYQRL